MKSDLHDSCRTTGWHPLRLCVELGADDRMCLIATLNVSGGWMTILALEGFLVDSQVLRSLSGLELGLVAKMGRVSQDGAPGYSKS